MNESDQDIPSAGAVSFSIELKNTSVQSTSSERYMAAVSDVCAYTGIETIIAEVYDENDVLLVTGGPWACEAQTGTIGSIPTGKDRKLVILCLNAEGDVLYSGGVSGIEINPGKTSRLGAIGLRSFSLSLAVVDDDSQTSRKGLVFRWNEVETAVSYRIIVSTDAGLSPSIVDQVTTNNYYEASELEAAGTYYWQVIAVYGNGSQGGGSEIQEIIITPAEDIDDDGDGFTENMGDCNDDDPETYPGAYEIECDGIDQDCTGGDVCTIVFVDTAGDVSNTGRSWEQAVPTLTRALEIAEENNSIWVKQGIYTDPIVVALPVNIYGGFSGDERMLDERVLEDNPTIIDCGNADARCVLVTSDTVIDGFHIQNGAAGDGDGGGGILVSGDAGLTVSADLRYCTFMNNATSKGYNGGAIYSAYGQISVSNCYFSDNRAGSGGAVAIDNTDLVVEDCRFVNNVSEKGYGGGIRSSNSVVVVSNTYFDWNQGASYGGGIAAVNSSSLIVNSVFLGNTALTKGGGVFINNGDVIITSCTFSQNTADCTGGAVAGLNLDPSYMTNSILYNDSSPEIYSNSSYPAVTYCDIQMTSGIYKGEGNINEDPEFADPDIGDLHLLPISPCIDAGDISVDLLLSTDIDGDPRILNDWTDMGADEIVVN